LANEFAETYFPGSSVSFVLGQAGGVLQIEDYMFRWIDVLDYIRHEASKEEIIQHHDYIRENGYSQTPFRFCRDQIKPKTTLSYLDLRLSSSQGNTK
jgi:hypothetical protein